MTVNTESKIIKVLLIEDNPDSIQLIQEELIERYQSKFKLEYATRLSTGLDLLKEKEFHVILLDMSLPDSHEIETLDRVLDKSPNVPIVVLTNYDDESFAIKAVQRGAQDYIVKRYLDGDLISRAIRYAIERHRMIKELEQTQLRLKHLALHDSLTDLPNRNLFHDHLNKSVARAKRQEGMLAVLFIDLDEFKNINDKLGHSVGDLMLLSVAKRLTECIRESDIVARMGGDEFTVILDDVNSVDDTAMVAEKILEAMSVPFVLEGNKISITASIGISVYPNDSSDKDTLMKNSDTAMYMAKKKGKNNYRFFLSELNENIFNKIGIQKERV